ncbi:MAG TPA: gluconate 2-dehydrogenase subunit 3 family protein [Candidatus Acidoferrum sp.]|jgi:hypothetical protein
MSSTNENRVLPVDEHAVHRVSRRELAQTLLSALAAGFVSPLRSAMHPIHRHLLNQILLDSADEDLAVENGKPLFLSQGRFAMLDVLAEAIVPGSREAQSTLFIDLLLNADTNHAQQDFLAALDTMESVAQKKFHAAIVALTAAELHDLLVDVSDTTSPNYQHFNNLKDWIAGAYYSSETGMRELGWTPDRVFSTFPACSHPDTHV